MREVGLLLLAQQARAPRGLVFFVVRVAGVLVQGLLLRDARRDALGFGLLLGFGFGLGLRFGFFGLFGFLALNFGVFGRIPGV